MVFVYLGRRDKKGMKVLTVIEGPNVPATRLVDLAQVIPSGFVPQMNAAINEDRMMYEPWVESAGSFDELKKQMRKRGYVGLPASAKPIFNYGQKTIQFDFNKLPKSKVMTQRQRGS